MSIYHPYVNLKNEFKYMGFRKYTTFRYTFSKNETIPFSKSYNKKDKEHIEDKNSNKLPSWIIACEQGIKIEFTGKPNCKIEGISYIDERELSIQVKYII